MFDSPTLRLSRRDMVLEWVKGRTRKIVITENTRKLKPNQSDSKQVKLEKLLVCGPIDPLCTLLCLMQK